MSNKYKVYLVLQLVLFNNYEMITLAAFCLISVHVKVLTVKVPVIVYVTGIMLLVPFI